MTVRDLCKMIPDDVRSQRLMVDPCPIFHATVSMSDTHMALLVKIWSTFIEPMKQIDTGCPICLENIRTNFRQMYETLVELEEEYQQLDML